MGLPVKLSEDLVLAARSAAAATDRSLTAQIEHWAKLGRAAEAVLPHSDVLNLKGYFLEEGKGGDEISGIQGAEASASRAIDATPALQIRTLLERVARSNDRASLVAKLKASGLPLYESAPAHPGMVIRVDADGKRTLGSFEGRRFVAAKKQRPPKRR